MSLPKLTSSTHERFAIKKYKPLIDEKIYLRFPKYLLAGAHKRGYHANGSPFFFLQNPAPELYSRREDEATNCDRPTVASNSPGI